MTYLIIYLNKLFELAFMNDIKLAKIERILGEVFASIQRNIWKLQQITDNRVQHTEYKNNLTILKIRIWM